MKRRQKKIFLVGIIILLILVIISVIIVKIRKENEQAKIIPQNNNEKLAQAKSQAISQIEASKNNSNISDENILWELKTYHNLDSSEADWKKYLNNDDVNSLEEVNTRRDQLINVINKLSGSPYIPPTPSTPATPFSPPTPPTNQWEKILWEIGKFVNSGPQKVQDIKDWLAKKNYPDPLKGINLKGVGIDELKKLPSSPVPEFATEKDPEIIPYKDWVKLSANGDGNCFLHSFSVFLIGRCDIDLTRRLRVAICLELINGPGKYFTWGEDAILRSLRDKINDGFTLNNYCLEGTHIEYLAHIFKRPLVVISKVPQKARAGLGKKFECFQYPNRNAYAWSSSFFVPENSTEPWVIYNSGFHFQPLIKK